MYELELFAGAGGGILAQQLLGHQVIGAVEISPYCRAVLLQRQRDLCLPLFPVWDDVTTFRCFTAETERSLPASLPGLGRRHDVPV